MNAAIFVVEFASLGFSIVSALGRIARKLLSSIPAMTAICSALSIACVVAMVLGMPIPSPAPLVLAALSLALLVRSVRESVEENRPAVITVAVPVAPEFAPLPEEIEDIAGSYPMVDRFDVAPPVTQVAPSEAPGKLLAVLPSNLFKDTEMKWKRSKHGVYTAAEGFSCCNLGTKGKPSWRLTLSRLGEMPQTSNHHSLKAAQAYAERLLAELVR